MTSRGLRGSVHLHVDIDKIASVHWSPGRWSCPTGCIAQVLKSRAKGISTTEEIAQVRGIKVLQLVRLRQCKGLLPNPAPCLGVCLLVLLSRSPVFRLAPSVQTASAKSAT